MILIYTFKLEWGEDTKMILYERKVKWKLRTCLIIMFVVQTTALNLIVMPKQ